MNLLDLYAKISIDTSGYEEGVKKAGEAGDDLGRRSEGAGNKIKNLGPLTVAAGKLIADGFEKALRAAKDFAKFAVGSSIEYESAFAKVTTIMDDTSVSSEDMSSAIKNLSSQMGISASDISNSVYDVISATGDTANAVSLVEQATKLAKGGFAETGDAVGVLTTAINAYGLSMEDAGAISDSLITVQNLGVTTVGELSGAMGKAIASGAAYGVNLNNLEAGYIALTKAGINTAEATTYQSSMFKELGDAGSSVGKILKEKTGKSFGELMSDGNSLGDVLKILNDSVDGNSEAFMGLWGSAEAGKGAAAIAGQGFEEFNGWLNELENSAGATQTAYETMSDTTQSKIDVLKTSFQNFAGEAAQPFIDKAMEFVPAITDMVNGFDPSSVYDKFVKFKDTLEKLEPIIAGVAAAILAYEGYTAAAAAITVIKTAMEATETTTLWGLAAAQLAANAPLLAVVGIIALVVAAGVALWKNWDTVKEKATQLKDKVVDGFNTMKTKVVDKVTEVKDKVTQKFDDIKNKVQEKIEGARDKVKSAIDKIKSFFNFEWSLPKLKMPHFSVSGKFSLNPPSIPSFGVEWYKKAMDVGYLFSEPTVVGSKGFGDAGAEMVIGRDNMMNMIGDAQERGMDSVRTELGRIYGLMAGYFPEFAEPKPVTFTDQDARDLSGRMVKDMNYELRKQQIREEMGVV